MYSLLCEIFLFFFFYHKLILETLNSVYFIHLFHSLTTFSKHAVGLYVDLGCRCHVHLGLTVSSSYVLKRNNYKFYFKVLCIYHLGLL